MSKMKSHLLMASAFMATSIVSQKKEDDSSSNHFEQEPIAFTSMGMPEWQYTPTFNTSKSRKCSNKKYVKRKKARNGKR